MISGRRVTKFGVTDIWMFWMCRSGRVATQKPKHVIPDTTDEEDLEDHSDVEAKNDDPDMENLVLRQRSSERTPKRSLFKEDLTAEDVVVGEEVKEVRGVAAKDDGQKVGKFTRKRVAVEEGGGSAKKPPAVMEVAAATPKVTGRKMGRGSAMKIAIEAIREERWHAKARKTEVLVQWEGFDEPDWNGKDDIMGQIGEEAFNTFRANAL